MVVHTFQFYDIHITGMFLDQLSSYEFSFEDGVVLFYFYFFWQIQTYFITLMVLAVYRQILFIGEFVML